MNFAKCPLVFLLLALLFNSFPGQTGMDGKAKPPEETKRDPEGGMSIGHKGMIYASKALALTMVDLFENEALRADIRKEFLERKGDHVYMAYIAEGAPVVKGAGSN